MQESVVTVGEEEEVEGRQGFKAADVIINYFGVGERGVAHAHQVPGID